MPPIALLTDFGIQDPYVGIMKGVIAALMPRPTFIDLTHAIPPGDVRRAAFVLWQSAPHFPAGTVFLAVVDPGVGTGRRGLALQSGEHWFVGPDNGLFTYLVQQPGWQAWALHEPRWTWPGGSATFHGRDLFAPAAAHLARGVPASALGPAVEDVQRFPLPRLERTPNGDLLGEVLHADRFGNLLTSLGQFHQRGDGWHLFPWLPGLPSADGLRLEALQLPDGSRLPLVHTFADLDEGTVGALVGSTALIEIVANRASAAGILALKPGSPVRLIVSS